MLENRKRLEFSVLMLYHVFGPYQMCYYLLQWSDGGATVRYAAGDPSRMNFSPTRDNRRIYITHQKRCISKYIYIHARLGS